MKFRQNCSPHTVTSATLKSVDYDIGFVKAIDPGSGTPHLGAAGSTNHGTIKG